MGLFPLVEGQRFSLFLLAADGQARLCQPADWDSITKPEGMFLHPQVQFYGPEIVTTQDNQLHLKFTNTFWCFLYALGCVILF